jgi:hypothetical protein
MNPEINSVSAGQSRKLLTTLLLVGVIALIIFMAMTAKGGDTMASVQPDSNMNQAVFLNNGEVYFGKITKNGEDFIVLEDIYYLRVTPVLQQQPDGTAVQDPNQQPQINLIKLGEELHGPEDKMVIPTSSVVYWENITNEGQVSTAIAEANAAADAAPADAPAAAAPSAQPVAEPQAAAPVEAPAGGLVAPAPTAQPAPAL